MPAVPLIYAMILVLVFAAPGQDAAPELYDKYICDCNHIQLRLNCFMVY